MPVTVNCTCGKVFKVKDESAGLVVVCQVCGNRVTVPLAPDAAPAAFAVAVAPPPVISPAPGEARARTINCPACAEAVPASASFCPMCGEAVTADLTEEEQAALIQEKMSRLDEHLSDHGALEEDAKISGGFCAVKTIVIGVILGLCALMAAAGALMGRDGGPLIAFGIILGVIFGIAFCVSLYNDQQSAHIQDAQTSESAYRRFFRAMQTNRSKKAFVCLIPSAREAGTVRTLMFERSKIPAHAASYSIDDPKSFKEYCKSIFTGPSGQTRTVELKKVKQLHQSGDMAVVEAEVLFKSYPSLIILLVLLGILGIIVCAILIVAIQKKDTQVIKKLLIKRQGRWFVAEGEFQGKLDKIRI